MSFYRDGGGAAVVDKGQLGVIVVRVVAREADLICRARGAHRKVTRTRREDKDAQSLPGVYVVVWSSRQRIARNAKFGVGPVPLFARQPWDLYRVEHEL